MSAADDPVDVAVLGGGPAGLAAALEARRAGARVALFDPAPAPRDKPCGEGLMASGLDDLAELVGAEARDAARPFTTLRWVVRGRELALRMPRPGGSLSRPRLVGALEDALRRHGIPRVPSRAEVARHGGPFRLTHAGGRLEARANATAPASRRSRCTSAGRSRST